MSTAKVLAVIPARLASTRLPEKPLKDIAGKTLLQRVWEQTKTAQLVSKIVIATDSAEIQDLGHSFGAEVMMTSAEITTGSARVAVVGAALAKNSPWDVVVNVQGDMPFIKGELIDQCVSSLLNFPEHISMVTVATPITDPEVFFSNSDVKVVVAANGEALYFSRAPIPHCRDGYAEFPTPITYGYKHFGLYAYRPAVLEQFAASEMSELECREKLEQLRLLEMGFRIGVCVVDAELTKNFVEVDTPADLARASKIASQQ